MHNPWRAYALALIAGSAGVALTRLTWPFFSPAPFAPAFGAVALSAHFGSGGAGLFAAVVTAVGLGLTFPAAPPFGWSTPSLLIYFGIAGIGSRLISGRNQATAALRASEARLRETLEQVRASEEQVRRAHKMEAVGQLAAGVAHNFNNLLQVTMGYTDVLLDAQRDAETDRMAVEEIRHATERGAALTRQLMALGRRHEARIARVDVDATVRGIEDMIAKVVREDIQLTVTLAGGGASVMVDPSDLEQILFNLVLNARDAMPAGGSVRVETARVPVDGASNPADYPVASGDYVRICVGDDGVGMSAEVLGHLFEPFFTTKEVGEGTGLGLAFVHGIARHAGGFVQVTSAVAQGTTVFVYLPVAAADVQAPAAGAAAQRRQAAYPAKILLVEDEAAVRAATEKILLRAGYQVRCASNADEACAIFDPDPHGIDLLLTDVVMPGMHGPELAARLAAVRPDLPVIFVSGYSDTMPSLPVVSPRAAFVPKPFTVAALVDALEHLLVTERR